jgi:hypothetical protein
MSKQKQRQKKQDAQQGEQQEKVKRDKDWSYDDMLRAKSKRHGYRG